MIWDKPIAQGQYVATPESLQAAWDAWVSQGDMTRSALVQSLVRSQAGGRLMWSTAHRMLRRAKREGAIRFNGRAWEVAP